MSEPQEKLDISDLKDTFLECPVCVEHFNQTDRRPRLLHSCLHAFCTQCLQQLLEKEGKGQITCPLCRQVQKVKGTADTLPADPVRGKLVEYVQIKHKQQVLCGECEEHDAVSRCQECQSYLCKECEYVHRRHRVSKSHPIISLDEVLQQPVKNISKGHFCPSHPQHHLEFYCASDEQLCCVSCTVLDHKGHDLLKLDEAAATRKQELETKIKKICKLADLLKEARRECTQQEKRIADTKAKSLSDIDDMFSNLKKVLDTRKRELVAAVHERSSNLLSTVQKTSASHEQTLAIIESTDTYFTQVKKKADVVEMLQMYPAIKRSVDGLKEPRPISDFAASLSDFKFVKNKAKEMETLTTCLGDFSVNTEGTCPICLDPAKNPVLLKCEHVFCKSCIDSAFRVKKVCPVCNTVCGAITGNMPQGTMDIREVGSSLPGYEGYNTLYITYAFRDGIQTSEHPNPGHPYKGTRRIAYLPDTPEGRKVLALLKVAWDRRLTFTIEQFVTIGGHCDRVTWNEIHHKTSVYGGPTGYGHPDPDYLRRVQEELAALGVTEEDLVVP